MLFDELAAQWLREGGLPHSTLIQRRSVYNREIHPVLRGRRIEDVTAAEVRELCEAVRDRGARAVSLHVRDVIRHVFDFAALQGYSGNNPAEDVAPSSIVRFKPRERALSSDEIRLLHELMDRTAIRPDCHLALKLLLLTLVRRSELVKATWPEIDFEYGTWTIPPGRVKSTKPYHVYLSKQALDILMVLKELAGGSEYILPSPRDPSCHSAPICLNQATIAISKAARQQNIPLGQFTLYDLRRTGAAHLTEAGFNGQWIDMALAHEVVENRLKVGDRAQHAEERRHMLQEWVHREEVYNQIKDRLASTDPG